MKKSSFDGGVSPSHKFNANLSKGDIGNFPAAGPYDFCNAFPIALHEWLFYVLLALEVPQRMRWLTQSLYNLTSAYSSGIGTNSVLS